MDLEGLYGRLPTPLQNVAVSLAGWRIRRQRYDRRFSRLLAEYEARGTKSRADLESYRDQRLSLFVDHASHSVPHYRETLATAGIDAGAIRTLADLQRLPLLESSVVREDPERFVSSAASTTPTIVSHTSGTTGSGLRFPVTTDAHREQWAVWWRYRGWHGIDPGRLCLYFAGRSVVPLSQRRPPFWRHNRPGRQLLFSGYHLGPDSAEAYLRQIARYPRAWIHGYPSLVGLLASYALQAGVKLDVERVTVGAESLMPQQAELIQRAFGCPAIEHYGMAEGVANISACPSGRLHVDEDYSAVEFVPADGGQFRVVGTNFSNPAFPLLRYDTGDLCRLPSSGCDCGRPGRVVERIDGRQEDYVVTRSGARLGRLDHIFKDLVRIREAQIRQSRAGEMTLVVVRGDGYGDADERQLLAETRKRVGEDVAFGIEYAERLPRTASGKVRLVVSSLSGGRLRDVAPPAGTLP